MPYFKLYSSYFGGDIEEIETSDEELNSEYKTINEFLKDTFQEYLILNYGFHDDEYDYEVTGSFIPFDTPDENYVFFVKEFLTFDDLKNDRKALIEALLLGNRRYLHYRETCVDAAQLGKDMYVKRPDLEFCKECAKSRSLGDWYKIENKQEPGTIIIAGCGGEGGEDGITHMVSAASISHIVPWNHIVANNPDFWRIKD